MAVRTYGFDEQLELGSRRFGAASASDHTAGVDPKRLVGVGCDIANDGVVSVPDDRVTEEPQLERVKITDSGGPA